MEAKKRALEEEKRRRELLEKRLQEETSQRQKLIEKEVKIREKQRAQVGGSIWIDKTMLPPTGHSVVEAGNTVSGCFPLIIKVLDMYWLREYVLVGKKRKKIFQMTLFYAHAWNI